MLSFVLIAKDWHETQYVDDIRNDGLLRTLKCDLESLEFNIYLTWMKCLKKSIDKMIVSAIIDSHSLPGFVTNEDNQFTAKLAHTSAAYPMEDLVSLLNNVVKAVNSCYLEDSVSSQAVTELLRLTGVTAFNDLLTRQNFLSWQRGLQINYNIAQLEEWCKSHDIPEGVLQLEHLKPDVGMTNPGLPTSSYLFLPLSLSPMD